MKAHIFVLLLVVVGLTWAENVKEEAEAFKSIRIGEDLKLECVPSEKDDKVKRDTKGETEGESQEGSGITPIKWIRKVNNNDKFEVLEGNLSFVSNYTVHTLFPYKLKNYENFLHYRTF